MHILNGAGFMGSKWVPVLLLSLPILHCFVYASFICFYPYLYWSSFFIGLSINYDSLCKWQMPEYQMSSMFCPKVIVKPNENPLALL